MIFFFTFCQYCTFVTCPQFDEMSKNDLTKKIWFAHQLVNQSKKRPISYTQYSNSQNKGNYGFYGVIILRKLPGQCPNLESSRKTFSMRRNLAINWRTKFGFYLPQKYFPKLQYDSSKLFGKFSKRNSQSFLLKSSRIRNNYITSTFFPGPSDLRLQA